MNTKRTFLSALLMLSLVQNNSAEAFSLNEFSRTFSSYTQFITGWTKENIGPILVATAFAIVAYQIITARPSNPYYKDTYSIPVLPQHGNTCAYHALKNGLICYEISILNEWINEARELRFTDSAHWAAQHSQWEPAVVKIRQKRALKNELYSWFAEQIQNPEGGEPRIVNGYKEIFRNIANGIAEYAVESIMQQSGDDAAGVRAQDEYPVTKKTILADLQLICQQGSGDSDQLDKQTLTETDNMTQYVPFLTDGSAAGAGTAGSGVFTTITRAQIEALPIQNDNLDGDEIRELLNKETDESIRQRFTIVDDVAALELLENFDSARTQWRSDNDYCHIFLVGTMSETHRDATGHWFLLAAQKKDGEKRYFTADSLGHDRRNDHRVKTIIEKLNTVATSES